MKIKSRGVHHQKLRKALRRHGYTQSAVVLSAITGRSVSYMAFCLSGVKSFQPKDMLKIMKQLNISKEEAADYFPPFGLDKEAEAV